MNETNSTTQVHLLFRGAAEVAKKLRQGALGSESAAATISVYTILAKPQDASAWLPLGMVGLTVVATALRAYSSVANGFAQRCRRISLRAFCAGKDVDLLTVSVLDDDAPLFVEQTAARLPAKSIEEYYEPSMPPGPLRQAELYAHSAFYTWRLLRVQAWVVFAIAAVVFGACAVMIYHLAAIPQTAVERRSVLEAISTVVLLVISVKGFEAWWAAYTAYREVRSIENALLKRPKGEALKDLIDSYDIERAAGPNPSTLLYNRLRDALAAKWNERRKSFVDSSLVMQKLVQGDS